MTRCFERDRPWIEHEYERPAWMEQSGLKPRELSARLTALADARGELPMPLLRAEAFAFLLDNAQISLNPHTPFADKLNLGIDYSDYAGQDVFALALYHRFHREVLSREMPEDFARRNLAEEIGALTADSDYWHTLPEWPNVLELGLCGLLRRAREEKEKKRAAGALSPRQEVFYDSVILSYEAIVRYVRRLRDASLALDMPDYTACLEAILSRPPQTLYEALETALLFMNVEEIGVERCRSLGRADQLWLPFYRHDLQSGVCTREQIGDLLRYFYLKLQAGKRYADQPFAIGGVTETGEDASNELTSLLLDVYDGLGVHNPKIHVCCHPGMPEALLDRVLDLIRRGNSSFCLINGETVCRGYERIGIAREESRVYVPFGCYEPVLMGKEEPMIGASWLNMPKAVEFAMNGGRDMLTGKAFGLETPVAFESFDAFYAAFKAQLGAMIEFTKDNIVRQDRFHMQINPSPVYSGTLTSCMEKGRDIFDGGAKYHNTSIKCCGIATVVDSLLMVKKFVFDEGVVSFPTLREALLADWRGFEKLRLKIRACRLKYGNHLPEADGLARDVYGFAAGLIVGKPNRSGGVFRMGCDSITNCVVFGRRMGATPDGRMAREATSKNFCASNGMDRAGVTAYVESVTEMDSADFVNGAVLDFVLHPSAVQGEAGLAAMRRLVRVYFEKGGYAIQGNVMNLEMLLDAQKHPENYRTLQVRVCGWNEYFVELSRDMQNEFIAQLQGS